jgi:hypothetical protein
VPLLDAANLNSAARLVGEPQRLHQGERGGHGGEVRGIEKQRVATDAVAVCHRLEVYGHLTPGYLQAEVDRLQFGLAIPDAVAADEVAEQKLAANAGNGSVCCILAAEHR